MAILGTYIDAGSACLGAGLTCLAHSLPTIPDFSVSQIRSQGANAASIPVFLESVAAAAVIWRNGNGGGINNDHFLIFAHSIIR